eukprot:6373976-Pyramimonas_sp.AAC.1
MLLAVSKLVEKGREVYFGPKGSYLRHIASGRSLPVHLRRGIYTIKLKRVNGQERSAPDISATSEKLSACSAVRPNTNVYKINAAAAALAEAAPAEDKPDDEEDDDMGDPPVAVVPRPFEPTTIEREAREAAGHAQFRAWCGDLRRRTGPQC